MAQKVPIDVEKRVLFVAQTVKEGAITSSLLRSANLSAAAFSELRQLVEEIPKGAGAILLTEEILLSPQIDELIELLESQPPWSDLPIVLLIRGGAESPGTFETIRALRNVTLLDRSAPKRSVVSAVLAAVRGRERQYEAREHIEAIHKAEIKARELQQQLAIAIDASSLGTFHCEMPLGKLHWNDTCKKHFWLEPDVEVDIERFYDLLHPDDRERTRQAVERCVTDGETYDIEYRTVSPDGEIRWVRATGRTYYDEKNRPVRFDGTTQDITADRQRDDERQRLLESERAARADAERVGRMKDEFLATLSHELRTPLNAILGWSQILRRGNRSDADLEQGLATIDRNTRAQAQLIEDLLDMSRITSGKVRLDVQRLSLKQVVDAAVETAKPSADAKEIRIEVDLDPAVFISGDAGRLQQVFWNLLSNAVKFSSKGGLVQVRMVKRNTVVEISVSDSGQGIKPEFLPHVFERFRQADSSTTRRSGGLGLGLAIVSNLVELHGGKVQVFSDGEAKGSTFSVTLPLLQVWQEFPGLSSPAEAVDDRKDIEFDPKLLEGVKVLVVDDEEDARRLAKRVLDGSGARVVTASTADEALECVREFRPDVLVSDVGMPEQDGYELLRRIRLLGSESGGQVQAIALTAFARTEDRTRAKMAGYQRHVTKPVDRAELIVTVADLAGRPVVRRALGQ